MTTHKFIEIKLIQRIPKYNSSGLPINSFNHLPSPTALLTPTPSSHLFLPSSHLSPN